MSFKTHFEVTNLLLSFSNENICTSISFTATNSSALQVEQISLNMQFNSYFNMKWLNDINFMVYLEDEDYGYEKHFFIEAKPKSCRTTRQEVESEILERERDR